MTQHPFRGCNRSPSRMEPRISSLMDRSGQSPPSSSSLELATCCSMRFSNRKASFRTARKCDFLPDACPDDFPAGWKPKAGRGDYPPDACPEYSGAGSNAEKKLELEKRKSLSVLSDHHLMDSPAAGDNTKKIRLEKRKSLSVLSDHHLMDSPAAGDNTESAGSKQQRQEIKQKKRTAQGVKRANTGGANPANVKRSRQNLIKDKTQFSGQSKPQKKWNPQNVLQHIGNPQNKENIDDGGTQPLEDHPQKDHQMSAHCESSTEKGIVVNSATRESDNEEEEDGEVHDEDGDFEEEDDEEDEEAAKRKRDAEYQEFLEEDAALERQLKDQVEDEQATLHFETREDQMQLTLKALTDGKETCFALCKTMFEQSKEIKDTKGEETLVLLCKFMQNQSRCLGTLSQMFSLSIDEILKPAVSLLTDLASRSRRKHYKKPSEEPKWKRNDLVLQIDNEQFTIECYSRKEVTNYVLAYQDNGLWPEPKVGNFGLKDDIQRAMSCYFSLIDEPRKLGYIVSQFLHHREFYQSVFIPKFGTKAQKKPVEDRNLISNIDKNLFAEILLYCGGFLLAEFPVNKDGNKPEESLRLQFVNIAREAVNQIGKTDRADPTPKRGYFHHIDNFIPILERDDIKSNLENLSSSDGRVHQSKNTVFPTTSSEPNTPTSANSRAQFGNRVYQSPLVIGHTSPRNIPQLSAAKAAYNKIMKKN